MPGWGKWHLTRANLQPHFFMATDNYFTDSEESTAPKTQEAPKPESEGETTTLIPKAICPEKEFSVGDEIPVRVIAIREGQYEVEYCSGSTEKPSEEATAEAPAEVQATVPAGMME
jgi:hypothetical protein